MKKSKNMFGLFKKKKKKFVIEHYPIKDFYVVRIDDDRYSIYYLKYHNILGIMHETDFFDTCTKFNTEEEALDGVKLYKEHQDKETKVDVKVVE